MVKRAPRLGNKMDSLKFLVQIQIEEQVKCLLNKRINKMNFEALKQVITYIAKITCVIIAIPFVIIIIVLGLLMSAVSITIEAGQEIIREIKIIIEDM